MIKINKMKVIQKAFQPILLIDGSKFDLLHYLNWCQQLVIQSNSDI